MRRSRLVAAGVAALLIAAVSPWGGAAAAAPAQEPGPFALSLSQTTGLTHGGRIVFELSGLAAYEGRAVEVRLCDEPFEAGDALAEVNECIYVDGLVLGGQPAHAGPLTTYEAFDVYPFPQPTPSHRVDYCSDEPYDCSVVAYVQPDGDTPIEVIDAVPVDYDPSPALVWGPGVTMPTTPSDVFAVGEPGSTVTVAQCVHLPDVPHDRDSCAAGPDIVLSATGRGRVTHEFAPTVEVDGETFDCRYRSCQVTVFTADGTPLGSMDLPGSLPSAELTVEPSTDLPSPSRVTATITSAQGVGLIGLCDAGVIDRSLTAEEGCQLLGSIFGKGTTTYTFDIAAPFTPYNGGPARTCAPSSGGCIVGIGDASGGLAWWVPVTFRAATMTVTPATGLLDGQEVEVALDGLAPERTFVVRPCLADGRTCGATGWSVQSAADGTGAVTVPVTPRFTDAVGAPHYCREGCLLVARVDDGPYTTATAGYAMAEGALDAAPATGLADGDPVTVSGTGLMASYDGPLVWIVETGEYVLAQCHKAIADMPTLLGVFTYCQLTGSRPVAVPGSTMSEELTVSSTVDQILGGRPDCAVAPGECVAALVRLEQDATLTLHTTPLSFST